VHSIRPFDAFSPYAPAWSTLLNGPAASCLTCNPDDGEPPARSQCNGDLPGSTGAGIGWVNQGFAATFARAKWQTCHLPELERRAFERNRARRHSRKKKKGRRLRQSRFRCVLKAEQWARASYGSDVGGTGDLVQLVHLRRACRHQA
jgi:hypothetical protein